MVFWPRISRDHRPWSGRRRQWRRIDYSRL